MVNGRGLALAGTIVLAALFLGGCLLSPRDPDGPPEGEQTDWETPITTTIVLENLTAALREEALTNYRDCFTEDYRFHVDPQDSLDAGQEAEARYANFVREDEEQVASRVFNEAGKITVSFQDLISWDESQNETYRQLDYELSIEWTGGSHMSEEATYAGRATLHMRRDDTGRWAIFRWVDRRSDPHLHDTWGVLKGDYRGS